MKKVFSIRLTPDLVNWVDEQAVIHADGDRTRFITDFLEAARERRLVMASTPAPFQVNDGSDPHRPVMVFRGGNGRT